MGNVDANGADKAGARRHERSSEPAVAEALVRAARVQGVTDPRVLGALGSVSRAGFVPEQVRAEVRHDYAIPIGRAQTTSQPSLIALMIEALEIDAEDTVLEVGTGYGYEAALLARLAWRVYSIERIPELAEAARVNLQRAGISNVEVVTGDGTLGLPERSPFAGIVVAAAFLSVPDPLAAQLSPGGKLVMPVGNGGGDLVKVFDKKDGDLVEKRVLCGARFVPLLGVNGFEIPEGR
ncbi:MAG: protein-L-isoaspartate(D-aspartate) O-methyltransferase [Acidimicrobiales bacterium]|jgi:protein-L-isoaspartate(D-aspartate) O-methyltransferase